MVLRCPCRPILAASILILTFRSERVLGVGTLVETVNQVPCVRLFHANGDVGCRAANGGVITAPLFLVQDESHVREIEELGSLSADGDTSSVGVREDLGQGLAIVMEESFFNATLLNRLQETGLVGGIILLEENGGKYGAACTLGDRGNCSITMSPDVTTPQGDTTPTQGYALDPSYPWNPRGQGLLMRTIAHPLVLVTGEDVHMVRQRAQYNLEKGVPASPGFPRQEAKMSFYFGGSEPGLNSRDCLGWVDMEGDRNPQCLPIGGQSAWASVGPPEGREGRETVVVTAGMDSSSLFHDRATAGANSAASALVALLAAAAALGATGRGRSRGVGGDGDGGGDGTGGVDLALASLPRQIVFAAFQAEAWGFTGSRRFVFDAFSGGSDSDGGVVCRNPLRAEDAPWGMALCLDPLYPSLEFQRLGRPAHVLAVDQVGRLRDSKLWLHPSPASADSADLAALLRVGREGLGAAEGGFTVENASVAQLPPTSLTAFVK
ncbi:unnamed protein product, partial [Discosporangium mesarthrocarpum]